MAECFPPLSLTDEVRGNGVGCSGEKGELPKVSGENEQLQAFLRVIWCEGQHSNAAAEEEQSNGDGNNKKSVKIVILEHILEPNPKP